MDLSLKSSVLSPIYRSFEDQLYYQNQLRAHYERLSRVKATVDCKAPTSYHKSITRIEQKNRSAYHSVKTSRAGSSKNTSRASSVHSTTPNFRSKANNTIKPSSSIPCSVADKISCYLEALEHHEFLHYPKMHEIYNSLTPQKYVPRSRGKNVGHSRLKKMPDCYTPAFVQPTRNTNNRKKSTSKDKLEEPITVAGYEKWLEEQIQGYQADKPNENDCLNTTSEYKKNMCLTGRSLITSEEKLDLFSEITEDILKSGLFSDKAIHETVHFHCHNRQGKFNEVIKEEELIGCLLLDLRVNENITQL